MVEAGNHDVVVVVDSDNDIVETDETNNIMRIPGGELSSTFGTGDVIIDVRHPSEIEDMPLDCYPDNKVICIPFFNLPEKARNLDRETSYLVFCGKGIMSRLHANLLRDRGFLHIGILKYIKNKQVL